MNVTGDRLFVANTTFWAEVDGVPMCVRRGERVREGHAVLALRPSAFEEADRHVAWDTEQATAAPGEKRGGRRRTTTTESERG